MTLNVPLFQEPWYSDRPIGRLGASRVVRSCKVVSLRRGVDWFQWDNVSLRNLYIARINLPLLLLTGDGREITGTDRILLHQKA